VKDVTFDEIRLHQRAGGECHLLNGGPETKNAWIEVWRRPFIAESAAILRAVLPDEWENAELLSQTRQTLRGKRLKRLWPSSTSSKTVINSRPFSQLNNVGCSVATLPY
jgi:hypothetical protein